MVGWLDGHMVKLLNCQIITLSHYHIIKNLISPHVLKYTSGKCPESSVPVADLLDFRQLEADPFCVRIVHSIITSTLQQQLRCCFLTKRENCS